MAERSTRRVTLPSGHAIDIIDYLTIGEAETIQAIVQDNLEIAYENKEPMIKGISFKGIRESTNKAYELTIKALYAPDGTKIEPLTIEAIKNLPAEDGEILKERSEE